MGGIQDTIRWCGWMSSGHRFTETKGSKHLDRAEYMHTCGYREDNAQSEGKDT